MAHPLLHSPTFHESYYLIGFVPAYSLFPFHLNAVWFCLDLFQSWPAALLSHVGVLANGAHPFF